MILHSPVLVKEVCEFVPANAQLIVDGTLGHGGHTLAMLAKAPQVQIIGIDIDPKMLEKAKLQIHNPNVMYLHGSYAHIDTLLGEKKADFILLDLGVNLEHFKDAARGFSIKGNAELDMRFDQSANKSAYTIVNAYPFGELVRIFVQYADFTEEKAQELAKAIVDQRKVSPIVDTFGLKKILNACGLGEKAIAVIFQAIRIETNEELSNFQLFLTKFVDCLHLGGRCAVISYHSGEDRLTKTTFKQLEDTGNFALLTKKAIQPHYTEVVRNKAARSAKLRVIEKII